MLRNVGDSFCIRAKRSISALSRSTRCFVLSYNWPLNEGLSSHRRGVVPKHLVCRDITLGTEEYVVEGFWLIRELRAAARRAAEGIERGPSMVCALRWRFARCRGCPFQCRYLFSFSCSIGACPVWHDGRWKRNCVGASLAGWLWFGEKQTCGASLVRRARARRPFGRKMPSDAQHVYDASFSRNPSRKRKPIWMTFLFCN